MSDPTLVFTAEGEGPLTVVCNFGMHAGREATPAEIDRLGGVLLHEVEPFEIVAEQRYGFDAERSSAVYQVRVELPDDAERVLVPAVAGAVETWALDCIDERRLATP